MATSRLNPYLTFTGNAREAMQFYQSVLGGDLEIGTFGEYGGAQPGDAHANLVMHARLESPDGYVLMASDTVEGMPPVTPGTNVTVSISGTDPKLRDFWTGLSAGGEVTMPMEKQVWGDEYGALTDRFGIQWMVDLGEDQSA
ncbi:VOC family protein [Kribbia dieselivorans]|uniref:VOC family protein n=1 Tax=Kribbia dieselivorans TaxID=331526 RepID=UPI000838A095|nr:VOC family protein [Kribbia dieselivorans]